MRITCHASFDDLAPQQARWNELARGVPFRRWEWLRPWWTHYGLSLAQSCANQRLLLLAVWDDGQLVAVAPWFQSRVWAEGCVIRALGAGEVCSEYVTILCQADYEDRVGAALAAWLTDSAHTAGNEHGWDLLELEGVVAGDRTVSRLLHHLTEAGNDVYPRTGLSCWRIELPARWEDVVARLSKSHRKQVRRARVFADGRAVVRHASTLDELQRGFDILVDLHARRWQSLGEAGCFARPHFGDFHREASALLFPAGCVDLMWVELDGRPLAAEYNLLGSDVLYAYQSGIDPDRLDQEPGRLAIAAALQWAIGRGLRSYDFLRGDEPYKVHWRAQPRPMWEIRVVPKRPRRLPPRRALGNRKREELDTQRVGNGGSALTADAALHAKGDRTEGTLMCMIAAATVARIPGQSLPSALAADWNRLAGEIPCRQWEWLEPWWRHYRTPGDELFVLTVHGGEGELLGIAPFYLSRSLSHGRVIRFLGSGDVCSDYLTILATPDAQSIVIEEVADYLAGEAANQWDLIELAGVAADDEAVGALVKRLAEREYTVHEQPGESCWRLELPADWDSYVKTLSKARCERTRQIIRRMYDTGRAVSRQVVEAQELPRYFDVLVELHQKRRRSLGEPGCFADPRFTAYHREVMERFFALGRLRLQYVLLDDRPVAIEYGLTGGHAIYFYQSGIETDVLDQRPGWMSTIGSLRGAIEQGFAVFDFMRGDEAYKSSWGAKPCPTVETRVVARRPSAQLRHTAWLAHRQMRRWAKAHWRRWRGESNGGEA